MDRSEFSKRESLLLQGKTGLLTLVSLKIANLALITLLQKVPYANTLVPLHHGNNFTSIPHTSRKFNTCMLQENIDAIGSMVKVTRFGKSELWTLKLWIPLKPFKKEKSFHYSIFIRKKLCKWIICKILNFVLQHIKFFCW